MQWLLGYGSNSTLAWASSCLSYATVLIVLQPDLQLLYILASFRQPMCCALGRVGWNRLVLSKHMEMGQGLKTLGLAGTLGNMADIGFGGERPGEGGELEVLAIRAKEVAGHEAGVVVLGGGVATRDVRVVVDPGDLDSPLEQLFPVLVQLPLGHLEGKVVHGAMGGLKSTTLGRLGVNRRHARHGLWGLGKPKVRQLLVLANVEEEVLAATRQGDGLD